MYKGFLNKSRTYDFAALVGVLGVVEMNFGLLEELLGKWYGLSYIILAVGIFVLRRATTGPVGEK